ncbi:MAG: SGNH/GDSL hydrolase family protein [Armatimonadota bacterium]|nr:SGNH/GDSL hydrolase family protein [Armatimonadota bacterium]
MRKFLAAVGALFVLLPASAGAKPADNRSAFPFHNGDRVVFLGDSITEQRLYTTYLETYLLTRFPGWKLKFRNAGWGGDTSYLRTRGVPADQALRRDVLDLHPTVVTIDFSMNDGGYGGFNQGLYDQHMAGEKAIVQQLQAAGVRPVVLTASAVEKNEPGDDMQGYNQTLEQFAAGDASVAAQAGVPFADQLHPFIDAINRLRATDPKGRLSSDVVHPGKPGHLMMADFVLTGLNAPALVSSVTIDAHRGSVSNAQGTKITNVVRTPDGGVTFKRLDDALVFPIEAAARPVLQIVPVAQDINRYMVQVTGLAPGDYTISVNGTAVTHCSASQLDDGVNLGYYDSPLMAAGQEILKHVYAKNNAYFTLWRNVQLGKGMDTEKQAQTATLTGQIADEERQINVLRRPAVFQFSVTRDAMPAAPPVSPVPAAKPA